MLGEQLAHVARYGEADVSVDVGFVDAGGDGRLELGQTDAVGVLDVAAQLVDLVDDVARDGGGAVAHECAVESLVGEALAHRDGDLATQLDVLALAGAMHGAIADGERVDLRLADEIDGGEWVGVGARGGEHVVLYACQHAELALDGDAARVGVLHDLAGELDVLLEGKRRARRS